MRQVKWMLLLAVIALVMPSVAKANAGVSWEEISTDCWKYHVTEYREGQLFHADLWHLNQTIKWCTDNPPVSTVVYGPKRTWSYEVNSTWTWHGVQQITARKLSDPTRWQFYIKAAFDGNGAYLITEHNYPWIRMTIWKRNPTHVAYTSSCGC